VRKNIRNDAYSSLFELSYGSALAIVLDTSTSMEAEIGAVKAEILEIIDLANEGGIVPSVYILAPYEVDVTLTVTKDPEEVKAALEVLVPAGGTENVFKALQVLKKWQYFGRRPLEF
jgi:Mg-chelatase subunit ChlD